MIFIVQNEKLVGCGESWLVPEESYPAPEGFTPADLGKYEFADGAVRLKVPAEITRAQTIAALILAGKDGLVQPAIDAIEDPVQRKLAQNDWDNRLTFQRSNPTLIALATAIGMTSEQLDQMFTLGATL